MISSLLQLSGPEVQAEDEFNVPEFSTQSRDNSAEGTVRKGTFYPDKSFFKVKAWQVSENL